ncbi:type II toxin-antitoxin system BrnA family antitoxin [Rubneribacter badeniensis]|uniref:type II toxin-antitoxin system BrnA family antitoxin n=1 Tax=Rubneribacter badeniensis TaxID=2070688 RepID=UPI000B385B96|nr:CopG family transcriptional regulator [Gordonibacter sp. An232A]
MAKSIKAEEFDRIFDEGEEDIVEYLDLSTVRRPNLDTDLRRVNVDFPEWMIDELDREAKRIGINRQAVIKTWIAERIDRMRVARSA